MGPVKDKVKVSNLPLLFVKGNPTSLELMSLEELQAFLRFVIKCEGNRKDFPDLDHIETPIWWPNDFEFSETVLMKQDKCRGKLAVLLKDAIKRCYHFHECDFLIEFCKKLLDYTGGVENLQVINNGDGTRSLIKRRDKKLLVTFKAENQDYDKIYKKPGKKMSGDSDRFSISSPMKTKDTVTRRLLSILPAATTSDPAMSHCLAELYLCDTCDKSFDSFNSLIVHEKRCAPPVVEVQEPTNKYKNRQSQFFTYMKLQDNKKKAPVKKMLNEDERPKATSYEKFIEIDVSSPLGCYLIHGSRLQLDQQHPASRSMRGFMSAEDLNNQVESKCPGTINGLKGSNAYADIRTKFPNVYRGSKRKPGAFVHVYSYNKKQRLDRYRDLKRGLTPQAYRLWRRTTKKKYDVRLPQIKPEVVKFYLAKNRQRLRKSSSKEENIKIQGSLGDSSYQPLRPLDIPSPSLTPDSSPSHSPRVHSNKHYNVSRQSSPGSAITIETSDSDADMQDLEDNSRVKMVPSRPQHITLPSQQKQYMSPLISVKLIEPLDEFAPAHTLLDEEPVCISPTNSLTSTSRYVPSAQTPVTGLSPNNRTQKSKSRHIPNILLKSKQSLLVAKQLSHAARSPGPGPLQTITSENTPSSFPSMLGLETTKNKAMSAPRAQMLTNGRQQSPASHNRTSPTIFHQTARSPQVPARSPQVPARSPQVPARSPQIPARSPKPLQTARKTFPQPQNVRSPQQHDTPKIPPLRIKLPGKLNNLSPGQFKTLSPSKQPKISPFVEKKVFARKSSLPLSRDVECVELSSGEE